MFQAQPKSEVTFQQKTMVFKLIQQCKDERQSLKVDVLWKKIMELPQKEQFSKGQPVIGSKTVLMAVVENLEGDNVVMYSSEDANIVLI